MNVLFSSSWAVATYIFIIFSLYSTKTKIILDMYILYVTYTLFWHFLNIIKNVMKSSLLQEHFMLWFFHNCNTLFYNEKEPSFIFNLISLKIHVFLQFRVNSDKWVRIGFKLHRNEIYSNIFLVRQSKLELVFNDTGMWNNSFPSNLHWRIDVLFHNSTKTYRVLRRADRSRYTLSSGNCKH